MKNLVKSLKDTCYNCMEPFRKEMKNLIKFLKDTCCKCMGLFRKDSHKFKECTLCDCETKCKKEKNDYLDYVALAIPVFFMFFVFGTTVGLKDVLQYELDYQFYLSNIMLIFSIYCSALFVYLAKKRQWVSVIYFIVMLMVMVALICYHGVIEDIAIKKQQSTAICSCCWERPADHREHSCH